MHSKERTIVCQILPLLLFIQMFGVLVLLVLSKVIGILFLFLMISQDIQNFCSKIHTQFGKTIHILRSVIVTIQESVFLHSLNLLSFRGMILQSSPHSPQQNQNGIAQRKHRLHLDIWEGGCYSYGRLFNKPRGILGFKLQRSSFSLFSCRISL